MAVEISPVVKIELLPSGIVQFLQDRSGPILTSTRKTTELRRGLGGTTGVAPGLLWFSWENSDKANIVFSVQFIEQIVIPGSPSPIVQSYTPLDNTEASLYQQRLDDIYEYLITYVFRGCCDDSGPVPLPYLSQTYAEWDTIRLSNELPAGSWVEVTDIPSQPDAYFSLYCQSTDSFALGGHGSFLNADWQNVGDYSGVLAVTSVPFTTNIGQWYAGIEVSAVDGDVVIWNCLHYQVIDATAFAGTDPAANLSAYALLPKATANLGYILETDEIQFDFPNDWLQYRADKRGNVILYTQIVDSNYFTYGFSAAIDKFQWGRDAWFGNYIDNGVIDQINWIGNIHSNTIKQEVWVKDNSTSVNANIYGNNFEFRADLRNNTFGSPASFISNDLMQSASLRNKTLGSMTRNLVRLSMLFPETISSIFGTIHQEGMSTQERSLDITGLTTIDISSNAEEVGVYTLTSSNATETINLIVNYPFSFPITLKPDAGLTVTFTFTPVASLSASGEIVGVGMNIVLNGNNGDYIIFESATINSYSVLKQIDAQTYT